MPTIGLVSDTHGTLHAGVLDALQGAGVERIWHAGDVGTLDVLSSLSEVAQVLAVRGNVDRSGPTATLPLEVRAVVAGASLYMTHIGHKPAIWLPSLPKPLPDVAICGHSHSALVEDRGGVLFVNPGACGTRPRFGRPLTVAILRIEVDCAPSAEILTL